MVSQIKTVCFDLDDTLVDNESGEEERLRKALGPLAERFPSFDIEDLIDRAMTIDPVQGRLVTLITETGLVDPKLTDEAYDLYDETVQHLNLFADVRDVLTKLQEKMPLGLVGNGDTNEQRGKIAHLDLEKHFKYILIGQEQGCYKPDPEMYKKVIEQSGFEPEEILFVGDRIDEDVRGPKEFNMQTVWVARGLVRSYPGEVQPDYTITNFGELFQILEV